jgi:hypothetical protein
MLSLSSYWHSVVVRAFWDSLGAFETNPRLLLLGLLGAVVTAALVLVFRGCKAFKEQIIANVIIAFGGAILTWLLVFAVIFIRLPSKMLTESDANLVKVIRDKQILNENINALNAVISSQTKEIRDLKNRPPSNRGRLTRSGLKALAKRVLDFDMRRTSKMPAKDADPEVLDQYNRETYQEATVELLPELFRVRKELHGMGIEDPKYFDAWLDDLANHHMVGDLNVIGRRLDELANRIPN